MWKCLNSAPGLLLGCQASTHTLDCLAARSLPGPRPPHGHPRDGKRNSSSPGSRWRSKGRIGQQRVSKGMWQTLYANVLYWSYLCKKTKKYFILVRCTQNEYSINYQYLRYLTSGRPNKSSSISYFLSVFNQNIKGKELHTFEMRS